MSALLPATVRINFALRVAPSHAVTDVLSAVNGQGIKDLTIKASFPNDTQDSQENDAAHAKNQDIGMNGSHAPSDAKAQVADFNLPTPTDSVVDSSAPTGASVPSTMETDPPAAHEAAVAPVAPEDPAVQQPVSESRDPVEPVTQAQAAEIQAVKETTDAAAVSSTPAPEPTAKPVTAQPQEIIPAQAEPAAPAAAVDAMDTSESSASQQVTAADATISAPALASNGDQEKPVDPAPTPAPSAPAEIKTEVAAAGAPLAALNTDTEMKDAPPSPGKMSRGREDDSGVEEPEAKRMRPTTTIDTLTLSTQSPANAGSPASPAPGPAGDKDFQSAMSEPQHKAISTVIANTKRSTHAASFSKPVDPVALNIPTYPDIITEPMDLGTMNEKVKNRKYENVQAFVYDFNLIIGNCERFNGPAHTVTGLAHKLRDTFDKQMARVPSADYVEPPPPEKKKKIAAPRAPARRESRAPAQPKTPVAASPSTAFALNPDGIPLIRRDSAAVDGRPRREIHPPASKDLPYNARPKKKKYQIELRFCSAVLHELDKAKFHQWAIPFKTPVDPVALNIPTYHKIIKKPMDLQTMRKRMDSGHYENAKDFEADIRLIFNNCYKFNKPEDWVYQAGKRLESEFDLEWTKKDDYIRANAPDNQSAGSSPEVESDEEEEEEDDDVPADEIAAIQSQIAAMSQQLTALQSKGKKKTPPALKKKGSKVKKEKMDKPPKKPSKKKGSVPYVSYEQKQDISNRINTLPEQRMMQALDIIKNNMPQLKGANDDELELDIDELSNEVLYKLLQFVKKYAPREEDATVQRRQSYAPTQTAKPKKNKPMGAREQETRIEQLKRMQTGDTQVDGTAEESSDDDEDEDSEAESEED